MGHLIPVLPHHLVEVMFLQLHQVLHSHQGLKHAPAIINKPVMDISQLVVPLLWVHTLVMINLHKVTPVMVHLSLNKVASVAQTS